MSGHSKWSKVKHQKKSTDAVKSQAFTKASRNITVAVKEGGGITDPNLNFKLRLAVEKAQSVNMPKENIERAIERAADDKESRIIELVIEAYGPGKVAMVIEAVTDNKQRTINEIKNLLDRNGGVMVNPGTFTYVFHRIGVITIKSSEDADTFMERALDLPIKDIEVTSDLYEVYVDAENLFKVKNILESRNFQIDNFLLAYKSVSDVDPAADSDSLNKLIDLLEEYDDITGVFTNRI